MTNRNYFKRKFSLLAFFFFHFETCVLGQSLFLEDTDLERCQKTFHQVDVLNDKKVGRDEFSKYVDIWTEGKLSQPFINLHLKLIMAFLSNSCSILCDYDEICCEGSDPYISIVEDMDSPHMFHVCSNVITAIQTTVLETILIPTVMPARNPSSSGPTEIPSRVPSISPNSMISQTPYDNSIPTDSAMAETPHGESNALASIYPSISKDDNGYHVEIPTLIPSFFFLETIEPTKHTTVVSNTPGES